MKKLNKNILLKISFVSVIIIFCSIIILVSIITIFRAYQKISFSIESKKYVVVADYEEIQPFEIEISFKNKKYRLLDSSYSIIAGVESELEDFPFGIVKYSKYSRLYRYKDIPDERFIYFDMEQQSIDAEMRLVGVYFDKSINIPSPTSEYIDRIEVIHYSDEPQKGKIVNVFFDRNEIIQLLSSDEQEIMANFADKNNYTLIRACFKDFDYLFYNLYWLNPQES